MRIMVMGPVGSGKSTQAELLAKDLGVPLLNMGDLLYFKSQEKSPLGKKIEEKMNAGEIVDDKVTTQVVEEHLKTPSYQKGFVLDGFPRTLNQAKKFTFKVDKVIYLKVGDEENIKRLLKRGRKDDTLDLIKKRLKIYHRQTEPILAYYREKGLLWEIDGERPVAVIFGDILKNLER